MKKIAMGAVASVALIAGSASAAVFDSATAPGNQAFGGLMASVVSVSPLANNLQVTELGAFDSSTIGFTTTITVALLNLTAGTNVLSTTFSLAGGEGKTAGSAFAFKAVGPVMLAAGNN